MPPMIANARRRRSSDADRHLPKRAARRALRDALLTAALAALMSGALAQDGVSFQLDDVAEVFGNVRGGMRRGVAAENRLELSIEADLGQHGWQGGSAHLTAFQINGLGPSRALVGNLLTVSNAEALSGTRLYEAFLEQRLLADKLDLRVGQLAADTRFITAPHAGIFLNGTFGWPGLKAVALPSGGPAYPLATPGIDVQFDPGERMRVKAGLFNGDPAGPGENDPQARNRHGLQFRVSDQPFAIAQIQARVGGATPRQGTVLTLGAWHHAGNFDDLRLDAAKVPLASDTSSGVPLQHRGNHGWYAVVDRPLEDRGLGLGSGSGVFARVLGAPADRNLLDFYVDMGIKVAGFTASRPEDSFGLALGWARISRDARAADRDASGAAPVRDHEAVVEGTYTTTLRPGWTLQPDLQYIIHPGGSRAQGNAWVVGLRTAVHY